MSTTVSQHHNRMPLIASAAVAAVIAGAGIVSLAWGGSSASVSHDQTPVLRTPTLQDYSQYNYYHGPRWWGGLDGHTPPAPPAKAAGGGQGQVSSPGTTSGGQTQVGQ